MKGKSFSETVLYCRKRCAGIRAEAAAGLVGLRRVSALQCNDGAYIETLNRFVG